MCFEVPHDSLLQEKDCKTIYIIEHLVTFASVRGDLCELIFYGVLCPTGLVFAGDSSETSMSVGIAAVPL